MKELHNGNILASVNSKLIGETYNLIITSIIFSSTLKK